MSIEWKKSSFEEPKVLGAAFANKLRIARGRGLGFNDVSRKGSRIPRTVRKIMATTVVEVMKILSLIMHGF